jgi:hypothetical protein
MPLSPDLARDEARRSGNEVGGPKSTGGQVIESRVTNGVGAQQSHDVAAVETTALIPPEVVTQSEVLTKIEALHDSVGPSDPGGAADRVQRGPYSCQRHPEARRLRRRAEPPTSAIEELTSSPAVQIAPAATTASKSELGFGREGKLVRRFAGGSYHSAAAIRLPSPSRPPMVQTEPWWAVTAR